MIRDSLSDILVVIGLVFMTLGIYGMIRMPDIYVRLHAASKSVFLGVITLAISSMIVSDQQIIMRLILLSVLLLITTPVSSHAIGRGAYLLQERMASPGAIDESGSELAGDDAPPPLWRL